MEPLAGFPNDSGGSGGGVEGGRSGVIVHWQERITLHYRLFPAKVEGRGDEHCEEHRFLPFFFFSMWGFGK